MKTILVLSVLVGLALSKLQERYNVKYESMNEDDVIYTRLLTAYAECFLETGPCTDEGADFKKLFHETLQTSCAKCTPKQREVIRTVITGFQSNIPELWEELVKKEDPEAKFQENLNHFLNSSD